MNILDLSDDSIAHICTFLNRVEDLSAFELTCIRIRRVITGCSCWKSITKEVKNIGALLDAMEKYVAKLLSWGDDKALLRMWPLCATSYDNNHENLDNVLSPIVKSLRGFSYWSSLGSDDESSGESLAFALDMPVCVIKSISVRPFQAWFQDEYPIYGSKKIQFRIGGIPMFRHHTKLNPMQQVDLAAADLGIDGACVALSKTVLMETYRKRNESSADVDAQAQEIVARIRSRSNDTAAVPAGQWDEATATWTSPQYDIRNEDKLQSFDIPGILCIGGYLRIDLIGRNSRQEIDNKYYTCLGRVCITGHPLPGFYADFSKQNNWKYGFDPANRQLFSGEKLGYETLYDDSSSESEMYTTQHQFNAFLDSLENIPEPNERELQASLDRFHRGGVFIYDDDDDDDDAQGNAVPLDDE
ncbi:hypothetical protein M9435_006688 [Picochlorum sp. BPE23]|nr:hypothetical protein M9435_006688 [Picochlorum sp. BPE23]